MEKLQCLLVTSAIFRCLGYNLSPSQASIFSDPGKESDGSYFGFSVGLQNGHWLVVGAPRANSTFHASQIQPGAVYQCKLQGSGECTPQLLDKDGHFVDKRIKYEESLDDAWIGASMDVQGSQNGDILVCGPRSLDVYGGNNKYMPGICYVTNVTQAEGDAEKLRPLRFEGNILFKRQEGQEDQAKKPHYFFHAFGQTGLAVHFTKDGEALLLGAPGILDWTGSVMKYKTVDLKKANMPNPILPNPSKTKGLELYSYLGYSLGSGDLAGGNRTQYVAGAPRAGEGFQGKVYVLDFAAEEQRLRILAELEGRAPGEYYGAALCVADVNGDGLDDVLVGAPHYAPKGAWDQGRLFVHPRKGNLSFAAPQILHGERQSGALFGSAVACLGDIDNDGITDFVVGAPFEDQGKGAIYVYHGRKGTLVHRRIPGEEVDPRLKGFGVSFSRGLDTDGNDCLDFAVGAHLSGHVAVLRSRPVITFEATLTPNVSSIAFDATGFEVKTCVKFTGAHAPDLVAAVVTLSLDEKYRRVRVAGTNKVNDTVDADLRLGEWTCSDYKVEILKMLQDFSAPIALRLKYRVKNNDASGDFCKSCPVESPHRPLEVSAEVPYSTGCSTSQCKPDLQVRAQFENLTTEDWLVIGTRSVLAVGLAVTNAAGGEAAFLAYAHVTLPPSCALLRVPQNCEAMGDDSLRCLMANPLAPGATRELRLELDVKGLRRGTPSSLEVAVRAESQGREQSPQDNHATMRLALVSQADVGVTGGTDQREVVYWRQKNEMASEVRFFHFYEVRNHGPSPVERMTLEFKIPVSMPGAANFIKIRGIQAEHDGQGLFCTRDDRRRARVARLNESDAFAEPRRIWSTSSEVQGLAVDCGSTDCVTVTCELHPPIANQSKAAVVFELFANLGAAQDTILFSTSARARIVAPTDVRQDNNNNRPDEASVRTVFYGKVKGDPVDLVVVASSVAGGFLLLILLILGLYVLGFFKRKRPAEVYSALRQKNEEEEEFEQ